MNKLQIKEIKRLSKLLNQTPCVDTNLKAKLDYIAEALEKLNNLTL